MARLPRELKAGFCYHVTIRCNNREFKLIRDECREVLLYAIDKCQEKYGFKLYALCIMSNHGHYLLEPQQPEDLPKIMHWLNWYTAMCFNRMLNRTGHFWEKRYHSTGFPNTDYRRVLNTLRYIHGQKSLWDEWNAPAEEIRQVAEKFVLANCLNPDVVRLRFEPP